MSPYSLGGALDVLQHSLLTLRGENVCFQPPDCHFKQRWKKRPAMQVASSCDSNRKTRILTEQQLLHSAQSETWPPEKAAWTQVVVSGEELVSFKVASEITNSGQYLQKQVSD